MKIRDIMIESGATPESIAKISKEMDKSKKGIGIATLYRWINEAVEPRHSKLMLFINAMNHYYKINRKRKRIKLSDIEILA